MSIRLKKIDNFLKRAYDIDNHYHLKEANTLRKQRATGFMLLLMTVCLLLFSAPVQASESSPTTKEVSTNLTAISKDVKAKQFEKAEERFMLVKRWWSQNKQKVKQKSYELAGDIDHGIAEVSLTLLNQEQKKVLAATDQLRIFIQNYESGAFTDNNGKTTITLQTYIVKLKQTQALVQKKQYPEASIQIQDLTTQWLSVEGEVVSQSQAAYDNAERDLMLLGAAINNPEQQASTGKILNRMISSLEPLADVSYTWFDAALIPFREGLEALLIIATLLTFTKRTKSRSASRWVVGGTVAGLLASLGLGLIVAFWLSTVAFGNNNNLINGWAGLIASIMMLYVSYWLHRNSDIKKWNTFLQTKSEQAISGGKMISFAVLAFLAILREGLETVVFLIGMAGRMTMEELILGIVVGLGVLVLIAFFILKFSNYLPMKPFFMASSAVVFYLCFKFMGSGIHSLQLAGVVPSIVQDYLPSVPALSIYPSWYSFLPQLVLVIFGVGTIIYMQIHKRKGVK